MKKVIFLLSFAMAIFSCQKANLHEVPQTVSQTEEIPTAGDRVEDCSVQITPQYGSGNCWRARIFVEGVLTAKICGPCANPPAGYTVVPWFSTYLVPATSYKKFRILQENLNVTYKIRSDAGCFNLSTLGDVSYNFYGGCSTPDCFMSVKVNSASSLVWLAEVRRINNACTDELVTTIGSAGSGASIIIPTGQIRLVTVEGFKQVYIKQISGSVNYSIDAPSVPYASISPATFTVNPGGTVARRLGCSN